MSRVWRQASRQVYRPKAYLEAGVKQGEAVEIAAKQIYVYNIKMKQASRQASRSPALWRARSRESKQASALEIAAKQLRQVSTMRTWSKTSNLSG